MGRFPVETIISWIGQVVENGSAAISDYLRPGEAPQAFVDEVYEVRHRIPSFSKPF